MCVEKRGRRIFIKHRIIDGNISIVGWFVTLLRRCMRESGYIQQGSCILVSCERAQEFSFMYYHHSGGAAT
jgi:hypothetical protein